MNRLSIRPSLDWRSRELSIFKRDMLQDLLDLKAEKRPFPIRPSINYTTGLGRDNINPCQHPPACRGGFGRHVRPPPPAAPHTSTGASVAPLGIPAPVPAPGKSALHNSPESIRCLSLPARSAKTQSRRRSPIGPHGASRKMQACLLLHHRVLRILANATARRFVPKQLFWRELLGRRLSSNRPGRRLNLLTCIAIAATLLRLPN